MRRRDVAARGTREGNDCAHTGCVRAGSVPTMLRVRISSYKLQTACVRRELRIFWNSCAVANSVFGIAAIFCYDRRTRVGHELPSQR
jgi:hypothetical protein